MGIEFLSGFGSTQPYYSRTSEIPTVTPEKVKKQDTQPATVDGQYEKPSEVSVEQASVIDNRSRTANLENISLTFNKEDSFDYIGSESSLMNLDIQKAISDMKKDSILQEYQYFVGSSQDFMMNPADGMVFQK